MGLHHLDHYTIEAVDIEATKRFYCELLGLTEGERPPLPFPGAWLYCEDGLPTVHVLGSEAGDAPRDAGQTGRFHHISFAATGADAIRSRLEAAGIHFNVVVLPRVGNTQFFMKDPNGVSVELNFPASETRQSDIDSMAGRKPDEYAI